MAHSNLIHIFAKKAVPAPVTASISRELGGGCRLPESVATTVGAGFGHDFSQVRVHTDARAAALAASLQARAFTVGHDIFFGADQYRPQAQDGTKLVAHELAHVAQQARAPIDTQSLEPAGSPAEREADVMAYNIANGRVSGSAATSPVGIPRDTESPERKLTPEEEHAGVIAYYESTRQAQLDSALARVRAELPNLSAKDIDERWKADRSRFIEIASKPDHGLRVDPMIRIYILYWADVIDRAWAKQVDLNNRRLGATDEFDRAVREEEYARAALSVVVDARMILEVEESRHKSLTIDELAERALNHTAFIQGVVGLASVAGGAIGARMSRPPRPSRPAAPPATPSRPVAGFGRQAGPPAPEPATPSRPVAGFGRQLGPPAPEPTTPSRPVAGFGRQLGPPAPEPVTPSPPVAGFGRQLGPPAPAPATQPHGTTAPARPAVAPPTPTGRVGTGPKMSGEESPAGSKPKVGKVEPVKPGPLDRIRQVKEWAKQNKMTGDVEGLQSRLRSKDPATRAAAEREFEEGAAKIRSGEKHHVEDFEDVPARQAKPQRSTVSTADKSELEDSAWLKKRLKSGGDRRKFMDWLKKGHKEGDLGAELKPGDRDVGKHEHLRPGSPEAEARVTQWEAEGKP